MSAASSLGDLDRDQKNCESRCPGTDVQVYYRRMLGEEPSDMISSVSGAPYSELPTAYLYRKSGTPRPAGCGCNASKNFEIITGNPPSQEPTSPKSIIQLPAPTTAPIFDPATADGGVASQTSGRATDASTPKTMGNEDRKVRVVGPRFLPDPEAAIDLRAPARRKSRKRLPQRHEQGLALASALFLHLVRPEFPDTTIPGLGRQQVKGLAHEILVLVRNFRLAFRPLPNDAPPRCGVGELFEIAANRKPEILCLIACYAEHGQPVARVGVRHVVEQCAI